MIVSFLNGPWLEEIIKAIRIYFYFIIIILKLSPQVIFSIDFQTDWKGKRKGEKERSM